MIDLSKPMLQADLAELIGVSRQAVSAAVAEGRIPDGLSLGETLQAYCHRLREQAAGRMGSEVGGLDLAQERAALAREMRIGHEMKNAITSGEYAPIMLLAEVLATASQSIVEQLDQVPAMLKKTCPDLPDAARQQVMVALSRARNDWVRSTEKLVAEKIVDMGDVPDNDEETDAES